MSDLVKRLCEGEHKVVVMLHPDRTLETFKRCVDRGYVRVKFTETKGGTELGFRLDPSAADLNKTNLDEEAVVTVSGTLKLDYVPVRCIAKVELKTMTGLGRLEVISPGN